MEHITLEEYKQLQQKGNSKYKNEKVVIDGIRFDSQKEANRWQELKILQKGGVIKDLRRQIHFQLQPGYKKNNKHIQAIYYIADFVYYSFTEKKTIVEDTKRLQNASVQAKEEVI